VLVERQRRVDDVVAGVIVTDMRLVAGAGPLDRSASAARGPKHQNDFWIDRAAQPIGAANVAGDQTELSFRNLQRGFGDAVAKQPGPLETAMQRVTAGAGVVLACHAARLDRIGGDAVDDEPLLDDVRSARERSIGRGLVAGLIEIGLVVGAVVVKLRRSGLEGVTRRHYGRAWGVIDRHAFGAVAGAVERVGDHDRDRIADVQRAADRNRRAVRQVHRAAVTLLVGRHRRHGAEAVGAIVVSREYGEHAGHHQRGLGIDAADIGVGVRRTHDRSVKLPREFQIVVIAAASGQQAGIFAP
jgi:hypothetical protein